MHFKKQQSGKSHIYIILAISRHSCWLPNTNHYPNRSKYVGNLFVTVTFITPISVILASCLTNEFAKKTFWNVHRLIITELDGCFIKTNTNRIYYIRSFVPALDQIMKYFGIYFYWFDIYNFYHLGIKYVHRMQNFLYK